MEKKLQVYAVTGTNYLAMTVVCHPFPAKLHVAWVAALVGLFVFGCPEDKKRCAKA